MMEATATAAAAATGEGECAPPAVPPSPSPSPSPAPAGSQQLKKLLEQHVRVADSRGRLYCHVLSDVFRPEDWADEPVGPRRSTREYAQARHTILVFMSTTAQSRASPTSSPLRRKGGEYVLAMGLTAWEYAHNGRAGQPSRAYIQHVDTTGLFRPRRLQGALTRAVISAYLRYCRQVLRVPFVHLFASAKPSLLFAGSELLARKRVLDSASLVNWWLAVLQTTALAGTGTAARAHVYCPGEENLPVMAQTLRQNVEILNRIGGIHWEYGIPYEEHAAAHSVIPLFEDDPKWRHVEASLDANDERPTKRMRREVDCPTVREFFGSLALRMEFRQDPSAFICIHFLENDHDSNSPCGAGGSVPRRSELAAFTCKLLKAARFDSDSDATKSAMRVWSWLKVMGSVPFEVAVEADQGSEHLLADQRYRDVLGLLVTKMDHLLGATPTDVQPLIRRKLPRA